MNVESLSTAASSNTAARVIPLLQALSRAEEMCGSLAMRLDPITNHSPTESSKDGQLKTTVTERLQGLGDTLQYLLDNIEL